MRTHGAIIKAATPEAIHESLGLSIHTVRSWVQRDSIPSEHWKALSDLGVASLEELAEAAAAKRSATQDAA